MKKGRGVSGRALFARHAITIAAGERVGQRHWRRPPRPKFTHKEDTMDEHSHESQEDQTAVAVVAEPRDPTVTALHQRYAAEQARDKRDAERLIELRDIAVERDLR
jgi:hypothetical protein